MANNPQDDAAFRRHLETSDQREVVYCHECGRQWYRSEYGLPCPGCGGEITEIVSDEFDPRPAPPAPPAPRIQRPPTPPGFTALRGHNPWGPAGDSDPDEEDITEHVARGPGNSFLFSRTVHHHGPPRRRGDQPLGADRQQDFTEIAGDFQAVIGNILGPGFQTGRAGRSGPNDLFNEEHVGHGQRVFGGGRGANGVQYTFTTTGGPRNGNGQQGNEPPIDIATLLGGLFGGMAPGGAAQGGENPPGMPAGMPPAFHGLLAQIFNPANARAGDAVYTQEAMDAIITDMMNQQSASNAPGPATTEAIAALPKKNLDEQMLGPEGKGECSVCMDDVVIGDEVVVLPCSHWFHDHCAEMWLKQHNTCPICRKGLGGSEASPGQNSESGIPRNLSQADRLNRINRSMDLNSRPNNPGSSAAIRAARLQSIRNLAEFTSPDGQRRLSVHVSMGPLPTRSRLDGSASSGPSFPRDPTPAEANSAPVNPQGRATRRTESHRSDRPRIVRPSDSRRSSQQSSTGSSRRGSQTLSGENSTGHDSQRGSQASGSNTTGALGWIRDRFGGGPSSRR